MLLIKCFKDRSLGSERSFLVRPARTCSDGCKSLALPNNRKRPADDNGVPREIESEGNALMIALSIKCIFFDNRFISLPTNQIS